MNKVKIEKILNSKIIKKIDIGTGVNSAYQITLANNKVVFVKLGNGLNEAKELRLLNDFVKTPQVLFVDEKMLILEFLTEDYNANAQAQLAEQLANLHNQTDTNFGLDFDNKIGSTPQINSQNDNWAEFYWQHRLLYQINLAKNNGYLTKQDYKFLIALKTTVYQLLDIKIKPALLHGDLWSGNFLSNKNQVYFIDSAIYYGHSEADLALGFIFGGFDDKFYKQYFELHPKQNDFEKRKYLYMLYHYLNHLNIFGSTYYINVINCSKKVD